MDKLSQALQTFDQAWAWTLNDVYVDVIYLVRFDCVNIGPVGAFVDYLDISTIDRVLGENHVLGVCTDHSFIADRGIATIAAISVKDIVRVSILGQFVTEGSSTENIELAWCAVVDLEQDRRGRCSGNCRLDLVDLALELLDKLVGCIFSEGEPSNELYLLEHLGEVGQWEVDDVQAKLLELCIILFCLSSIAQHQVGLQCVNLLDAVDSVRVGNLWFRGQRRWIVCIGIDSNDALL